jgi:hypothetical protein
MPFASVLDQLGDAASLLFFALAFGSLFLLLRGLDRV